MTSMDPEGLDRNIGNAYKLIEETYKFCTEFFDDIKTAIADIDEEMEPIEDVIFTGYSYSLDPQFMFTRAFGTFFGKEGVSYDHGHLSLDLQLPFVFFRLAGGEQGFPYLIYGHFTDFEESEEAWKKRQTSWFNRPLYYKDQVFAESPVTVEGKNLNYEINFEKDRLSAWIEDDREEQWGRVEDLAKELEERYQS